MKLNLSKRIAIFVGALIIFVSLILGLTAVKVSSDIVIKTAEEAMLSYASESANELKALLDVRLAILNEVAIREKTSTMVWETQKESLIQDVERLGYLDMAVVLPDGTANYVLSGETAQLGDREYIKKALQGEANISDVIISKVTGTPVLIDAAPIKMNNKVVGVLIGRRDGVALNEITDKLGMGKNGYAFIVGADSTFYAHPKKEYVINQINPFKEIETKGSLKEYGLALQALGVGKLGLANYQLDGINRISAMAPIPGTNWTLGVGNYEEEFLHGTKALKNIILIISAICVILGVIGAAVIGGFIAKPITYLSNIVSKLSNYDLTKTDSQIIEKHAKRTDEIGIVAKSIIGMRDNFIELINQVSTTSQQVAASSEELTSTSQQAATAADEVATTIEEIARGATDQAKETEQGASSVNVLSGLITKEQKFLKELNNSAEEVNKLKDEGIKVLVELVMKTKESGKATKDIHDVIFETSQSASKIDSASQMIKSIAHQTNLLALNAAIEAARAGEAGKGFSVVADEIRKLAEQSNSFTDEIMLIIKELSEKTQRSVTRIKEVSDIVSSQAESVESTNEKFEGITEAIEKMKNILSELNESGKEMEIKKEDIVGIIENLSAISEENAAGAEQASAAVEEQTASMQQIADASEELALLAEDMQKVISQFILD